MADHFGKCVKMLLRNYQQQLTYKVGTLFVQLFDSLVRTLYAKFQETPTIFFSDLETHFVVISLLEFDSVEKVYYFTNGQWITFQDICDKQLNHVFKVSSTYNRVLLKKVSLL